MSILKGLTECWMSPTGRIVRDHPDFYHSTSAWHEQLAMYILADKWRITYDETVERVHSKFDGTAYEELESMGWIRLSKRGAVIPLWITGRRTIPKKQEETILEWCRENGADYRKSLSKY